MRCPKCDEYHAGGHGGSVCAEKLQCTDKLLFARSTASCDITLLVVQLCGGSVQGISKCSHGSVSLKKQEMPLETRPLLLGPDIVDETARNLSRKVIKEIQFLSLLIFENVSKAIFNNLIYSLCEEWPELENVLLPEKTFSSDVCFFLGVR